MKIPRVYKFPHSVFFMHNLYNFNDAWFFELIFNNLYNLKLEGIIRSVPMQLPYLETGRLPFAPSYIFQNCEISFMENQCLEV